MIHPTMRDPVLVIGFNRPHLLRQVIARLRQVQPARVYLAVDGPRADRPNEVALVENCRDLAEEIDWPCTLETLFQDTNLGCGLGVSTAISWFFAHEERGIILEDDILPESSFFSFCSELLDRYQDDERVFAISGCNFVPKEAQTHPDLPYRFSQVPHIWGWATWRRSWLKHELDISGWQRSLPPSALWRSAGRSIAGATYWASTFELLARGKVDTWDGQLVLASMVADQLTATSNVNLIENIGFGAEATHTVEDRNELQPLGEVPLPLAEVPVQLDAQADAWTRRHHFRATWRGIFRQAQTYLSHKGGRTP